MAGDGYDLNVDVDFDDEKARQELRQFTQFMKKQMSALEALADVDVDVDTLKARGEVTKFIAKTNTAMTSLKKGVLDVELKETSVATEMEKLRALTEKNTKIEARLDVDLKLAEAKLAAFKAKEQATPINKNLNINTGAATAQMLAFSRGIEQVVGRAGSLALLTGGAGLAVGAVGTGIAGFGLATAASMDQARWAFENLMGSAEAAAPIMEDLKRAALNTPFDLNDVISLAFRLKSAGRSVQGLAGDAETLADALAATGGGAQQLEGALFQIQQLQGRSKILEREDLRTLNNQLPGFMGAFNRLFGDKREFGSPEKAMEAVFAAIKAIPGAAGAAARATEQTFMGRFSKFKDNIQIQFSEAFMPKKEVLFAGMDAVSDAIGGFLEQFAPVGAETLGKLGPILADLLTAATPLLVLFTEAFPKVLSNFVPVVQKISDWFTKLGWSSDQLADALTKLLVGGAILKFGGMLLGLVTPFLTVLTSIGPIVAGLSKVGAVLASVGGWLSAFIGLMGTAITSGGGFIATIKAIGAVLGVATGPIGWIVLGLVAIGAAIFSTKGALDSVVGSFKNLWKQLQPGIALIGLGLTSAFKGVMSILRPFGILFINVFKWIIDSNVIGDIIHMVGILVGVVGKAVEGIGWLVENTIGRIPGFNKIISDSGDEGEKAVEKTTKAVEKFVPKMREASEISREVADSWKSFIQAGLPELDTSTKAYEKDPLGEIRKNFDAQLVEIRKRNGNITALLEAGYSTLVQHAFDTGGELGVALMEEYAKALADGREDALKEFETTLLEMKKLEEQIAFETARNANQWEREFAKSFLGTEGMMKEIQQVAARGGDEARKAFMEKWNISEGTETSKVMDDLIRNAKEGLGALSDAELRVKASVDTHDLLLQLNNYWLPPEVRVDMVGVMDDSEIRYWIENTSLTNVVELLPLMDDELIQNVLGLLPDDWRVIVEAYLDDPAFKKTKDELKALEKMESNIEPKVDNPKLMLAKNFISETLGNIRPPAIPVRVRVPSFNFSQQGNSVTPVQLIPKFIGAATGSQFYPGGWGLVGEHGPEMVQLPRGSKIYPAVSTERMMNNSNANSGREINIQTDVHGVNMDQATAEWSARVKAEMRKVMA